MEDASFNIGRRSDPVQTDKMVVFLPTGARSLLMRIRQPSKDIALQMPSNPTLS